LLTEEAHHGFHAFARAHGTNASALLEALGRQFGKIDEWPSYRLPELLLEVIADARAVTAERSRRVR
jgi:hypothetical protein